MPPEHPNHTPTLTEFVHIGCVGYAKVLAPGSSETDNRCDVGDVGTWVHNQDGICVARRRICRVGGLKCEYQAKTEGVS